MSHPATVHLGVGIDTARYGHRAAFLREDRQQATGALSFAESREGYSQLEAALDRLARRHGGHVHFHVRLDAAGQYAVNLEAFLRRLPFSMTVSVGEPKRNRDYKNVHFPKRKSDAVDALACARFAVVERPAPTPCAPPEFAQLRDLAGALEAQRKQTTREINQLHNHLARVFPELALLTEDISAGWVLELLHQYPTPQRIARARLDSLARIPYLSRPRAEKLKAAACRSTGSLQGELAEGLVRQLVTQVRHSQQAERRLEKLIEQAFDALPDGGHRQIRTIKGIGKRTAAALAAKIVSIDRFASPEKLVSYFGLFPEENTSGVDKRGRPIPCGTMQMSAKGNDLVRGLLWMACQSAIRHNPVIRALYARQRAAGKRGDVALGHCMRKMLHLVFAVWKTNRPFDPHRHAGTSPSEEAPPAAETAAKPAAEPAQEDAAGRKGLSPDQKAVTAAVIHQATRTIPREAAADKSTAATIAPRRTGRLDFAALRRQIRMADVLRELGMLDRLHGRGPQRRGSCPVHDPPPAEGRTFSVNLDKHVFRCLHPECRAQGNVLDLWAAVHKLPLRDAAEHLANTFQIPTEREQTSHATHRP